MRYENYLNLQPGMVIQSCTGIEYTVGKCLIEGKTKIVFLVAQAHQLVLVQNKDTITKNDDPSKTRTIPGKGALATETTCLNFRHFENNGIPTTFRSQIAPNVYLAERAQMIPLELIHRLLVPKGSSLLKREPHLVTDTGEPYAFIDPKVEFFLKTSGGQVVGAPGIIAGAKLTVEDPLIHDPFEEIWDLMHPKMPAKKGFLGSYVKAEAVLEGVSPDTLWRMTHNVGKILKEGWASIGYHFADGKQEIGVSVYDGKLKVSDCYDADSCRVYTPEWKHLSKQMFREMHGVTSEDIEEENKAIIWAYTEHLAQLKRFVLG